MGRTNKGFSEEEEVATTTKWGPIYVATALSFVGAVQFSLYFSSMWPYLQIIDPSTTENFFGLIIAVYSLGQIISAPTFGYWSNKIRQVRLPLYVGLLAMFIGNAFYLAMAVLPLPVKYVLMVGRFVTGTGSGNVVLLRTYACTASTFKDRPRAIAFVTCGQAMGQVLGPAFQLMFAPLHYPGLHLAGKLYLNLYTGPAFLACAMNACGAMALYHFFKEEYAGIEEGEEEGSAEQEQKDNKSICSSASTIKKIPPYDRLAAGVCCLTRFSQMFIQTNLETLGSVYSMMMFGWTARQAVIYGGIAQGAIGVLTLCTYIIYMTLHVEKIISFRKGCIVALASLALFHVITYPWPFLSGHVPMYNSSSAAAAVGCNLDKFDWCNKLSPVNVYLYYISYVLLIGLAFPTLNIKVVSLFSKVLGPRRQGTQQGILQMNGGVARMLGPIVISGLYSSNGPTVAWQLELVVISGTVACWIFYYNRMVPLKIPKKSCDSTIYNVHTQKECGASLEKGEGSKETRSPSHRRRRSSAMRWKRWSAHRWLRRIIYTITNWWLSPSARIVNTLRRRRL